MDYECHFRRHLEALHAEGRYRIFADLKRRCGAYPTADHFADEGVRDVSIRRGGGEKHIFRHNDV
jgi:5-aminolevulinate synthase